MKFRKENKDSKFHNPFKDFRESLEDREGTSFVRELCIFLTEALRELCFYMEHKS
jgi:hypothetical protein